MLIPHNPQKSSTFTHTQGKKTSFFTKHESTKVLKKQITFNTSTYIRSFDEDKENHCDYIKPLSDKPSVLRNSNFFAHQSFFQLYIELMQVIQCHTPMQEFQGKPSPLMKIIEYSSSQKFTAHAEKKRIIEELIKHHPTMINYQDSQGKTALMLASLHPDDSIIKTLLQCGANTDIKDYKQRTAIDYARITNNRKALEHFAIHHKMDTVLDKPHPITEAAASMHNVCIHGF